MSLQELTRGALAGALATLILRAFHAMGAWVAHAGIVATLDTRQVVWACRVLRNWRTSCSRLLLLQATVLLQAKPGQA